MKVLIRCAAAGFMSLACLAGMAQARVLPMAAARSRVQPRMAGAVGGPATRPGSSVGGPLNQRAGTLDESGAAAALARAGRPQAALPKPRP